MKKYVLSSVVGGGFFAASYLLLSLGFAPSLGAAVVAFGASSLIFKDSYNLDKLGKENLEDYKKLVEVSQTDLVKLKKMQSKISDEKIGNNVSSIIKTSEKIIKVLLKKPEKISSASKFLNYYLPITVRILEKYEEIEDQNLTSNSSLEFTDRIRNLIVNIELAFENQLNNLYSSDLIDTNAEIKVFETVLKSDGLLGNNISIKKDGEVNE